MGDLKRKHVPYPSQKELIGALETLKELTVTEACEALKLNARRYYRWRRRTRLPAVKTAWNRITPEEEATILTAARNEALCDMRAAGLMVYGHESRKFFSSVSTVQRVLKRNSLQTPYQVPRRKRPVKPDVRELMTSPRKVVSYDATEFYLINRVRVVVVPMLDLGSRKFLHYGVRVRSFTQKDIMAIWDETLWKEDIDPTQLTALSDRGGQMKGSRTKAHLIGKWNIRLEFARPYTPDDNGWIETFIKYMKYHPECPDAFETVQDVIDWVAKFQKLYNDHPHSSLGYVRPNDEHAGLGNTIRGKRQENLKLAAQKRRAYNNSKKEGVPDYDLTEDRGSNEVLEPVFALKIVETAEKAKSDKIGVLKEALRKDDFRVNSEAVLCQNR
ncbi:MAG: DDE-type integrase/transposase/recombinase [Candidatus Omnitrophica bacterium]|nr:DDE-type integrase/transposase/recombinase [Candidatus Omnitrophota bacterium]